VNRKNPACFAGFFWREGGWRRGGFCLCGPEGAGLSKAHGYSPPLPPALSGAEGCPREEGAPDKRSDRGNQGRKRACHNCGSGKKQEGDRRIYVKMCTLEVQQRTMAGGTKGAKRGSDLAALVRTVLGNGFKVLSVVTKPRYAVVGCARNDEFGIRTNYLFACCASAALSRADCDTLEKLATEARAGLVIVGKEVQGPTSAAVISKEELMQRLGGPVASLLPLEPEYPSQVLMLAKNRLPHGVVGKPDDLFEVYTHAGLQFLLGGRILRYGQERRFEALPDGIVINSRAPIMLYDCKAAEAEFEITKETIRQFADYVRNFRDRYEKYLDRPHAFVVVSSKFGNERTLRDKANQLYVACQVPLVCMSASCLAECVKLFVRNPSYRMSVEWKQVFVPPSVEVKSVKAQLRARMKDGVIRRGGHGDIC
jgi:hypothetical protein